jgi:hypothetical protein
MSRTFIDLSQQNVHDRHNGRQAHYYWLLVHAEQCRSGEFARLTH